MTTATATFGDTAPDLKGTATSQETPTSAALPVDLTSATAVAVHIERPDHTVISRAVTPGTDAGSWSMAWHPDGLDLTVKGEHAAEIQVTWGDGVITTFGPTYFKVREPIA